jgi:sugar phosphate isomerase/epimerase
MNTSRRFFLKQTTFAFAGATLFSHPVFREMEKKRITGVQLYSVRDDMEKNPTATLHTLADMGYKYVEHANYVDRKFYGYHAKDFKKLLDDLDLKMRSGHTVMRIDHWDAAKKDFTDEWKATVEDAATMGQQFVISPWMDEKVRDNHDALMEFLDLFNKSGELCKKSGMKFGYHNHDFEISTKVGDETLYDVILKNTDPSLVIHQLDIGNFYGVGGRGADFINRYPGRFISMHVKDEVKAEKSNEGREYESTVLGKGVVNVKEILKLAKKNGTEHFIIEQESYQGQKPLDAVKADLQVMKKWGFDFL